MSGMGGGMPGMGGAGAGASGGGMSSMGSMGGGQASFVPQTMQMSTPQYQYNNSMPQRQSRIGVPFARRGGSQYEGM